ncbi:hypothetical protein RHSIM_Rhsim10G0172800 [Rhododendron simsii]|uniref:Uncharacterized protein n=1 Tax=Rhododendron simsii TaxID=118357 RepID=A0A834G9Q1_RHOSS|nr:hypothetical protein RHSIM_Rhsim10G0172800 [Rhododendron simsii]
MLSGNKLLILLSGATLMLAAKSFLDFCDVRLSGLSDLHIAGYTRVEWYLMSVTISLQMSHDLGICKNHGCNKQFLNLMQRGKLHLVKTSLSSLALLRDPWSIRHRESLYRQNCSSSCKHSMFRCHSFLNPGNGNGISCMKNAAVEFTRSVMTLHCCSSLSNEGPECHGSASNEDGLFVDSFCIECYSEIHVLVSQLGWTLGSSCTWSRSIVSSKPPIPNEVLLSTITAKPSFERNLISCRSCTTFQGSPIVLKLVSAVGIIAFAVWGLGPVTLQSRHKNDSSSKKSDTGTYHATTSYLLPLLLWTGVTLICRELDPVVLPSEGSQIVKQRILNFIRSLSTVLALAYYLSSAIQQAQKFFMGTNNSTDPRPISSTGFTMGFQFISKTVYPAVLVAAVALFLELLGISTQKLLTAGGLGTVLLTFAGREIFRNFLSSAIIHATQPFSVNDWIQTKIEGYDVSGYVERVGWWTPTIIRGENREAVHIPNHQFTVNVVSNLSQKTHWRIKTHLEISYLDFDKISNIVADMRKLLAKNPHLEHKKLHRRVFLVEINPKNPGLVILVSCFVKTSHVEEYKCVREAILLDLIRIITHHRARLATPIRTVQYSNSDFDEIPFSDSPFNHVGVASNRPLLLTESSYKINSDDRTKPQNRSTRTGGEQDGKATAQPPLNGKTNAKVPPHSKAKETPISEPSVKHRPTPDSKVGFKAGEIQNVDTKEENTDRKVGEKAKAKSKLESDVPSISEPNVKHRPTPDSKVGLKAGEIQNLDTKEENTDRKVGEKAKAKSKLESDFPSIQQSTQQTERPPQPPVSRPPLEENIVLGVALGGSKRTLPIEEGMAPAPVQSGVKEMAKSRTGNGSSAAEMDKKDSQLPNVPSTTSSGDQGKPQN